MSDLTPVQTLRRISSLAKRIEAAEEKRARLVAERNLLFAEARRLDPPLTMTRLGEAAGISQPSVTNVLKAAASV